MISDTILRVMLYTTNLIITAFSVIFVIIWLDYKKKKNGAAKTLEVSH